jgi:hypothetical protein
MQDKATEQHVSLDLDDIMPKIQYIIPLCTGKFYAIFATFCWYDLASFLCGQKRRGRQATNFC